MSRWGLDLVLAGEHIIMAARESSVLVCYPICIINVVAWVIGNAQHVLQRVAALCHSSAAIGTSIASGPGAPAEAVPVARRLGDTPLCTST